MSAKDIERLARAIQPELDDWDRRFDGSDTIAYNAALRFLQALREPSLALLKKAAHSPGHYESPHDHFTRCWRSAIDALLNEA